MGMSTDGNICFGISFPEDHPFPWGNYEEGAWWEEHGTGPFPVALVNVCNSEYPIWIVAVPSSTISASRGNPQMFDPTSLVVTPEETKALIKFCEDHCLSKMNSKWDTPVDLTPRWYLASYTD